MNTNDSIVEAGASWVNQNGPRLPGFFVGLAFGFVLVRVGSWIGHFVIRRLKVPRGLKGILGSLIDAILWFLYVVAILQALGFKSIIIFFTSSIAAIALIMAAGGSTLISDIFAGIFLAQDKDFRIGDEVIAGDPATQGVVEAMDMRRTRVRDKDGKLHIMPNSIIERKEWVIVAKKVDLPKTPKPRKISKLGQNYKVR